ncbi:MAG TPA: NAD(P)-dependent oxidoreductase [Chloroflexota bacterium]
MAAKFRVGLDRGFLNAEGKLAWGSIGVEPLEAAAGVEVAFLPERLAEFRPGDIRGWQGLILGGPVVGRAAFAEGAADLVVIARAGVGYDQIDVDALTENDVALCTTPAASRHAVASASFAYLLALAKRMADKDRLVRQGRWDLRGAYCGNEIYQKTLGILGFGNTGAEMARLVAPFEMRVLTYDPYLNGERAAELGVESVSLDRLMREADFVCVHALLNEQTRGLVGARELALMKPSAYFINCARGPIVDQAALIAALQSGRVAGAGLDVFEEEPLAPDSPLIRLENVMLSPHTMAHTYELSVWMGNINSEQMLAAARGEAPGSVVNRAVLERPGFRAKLARWRGARP